jgi:phage terminase small subunit
MGAKGKPEEVNSATNPYGLTPMQWQFVQMYPICEFNGTKAAIAAGFKGKRPDMYACRTLRKPKVHEALQDLLEEDVKTKQLTRQRVLQEWMNMAFFNLQDIGDNPGRGFNFERFSDLPRSVVAAIESIDHTVGRDGKVRMSVKTAKTKALQMVTKLIGMLEPAQREEGKGHFSKWMEEQRSIDDRERAEERDREDERPETEGDNDGTEIPDGT